VMRTRIDAATKESVTIKATYISDSLF